MYYIYRITNKINGKTYIGKHKYKKLNDNYMGSGVHLRSAQKKYGIENFEKKILVFNISKLEHANLLEKTFIAAEREKVGRENCYNKADGGDGGDVMSIDVKRKMYEIRKKYSGKNHPMYGKHHSEESRKKMSEAAKGRPGYWLGKHLTEEAKRKSSESHKGKHLTEEQKRKISESNKGKCHSEESIRKMSESKKGHKVSEETRKKISETNRGKHWYNNGKVSITANECPEGFVKGRICKLVDGKKVYR